jgi:hypothetical protein
MTRPSLKKTIDPAKAAAFVSGNVPAKAPESPVVPPVESEATQVPEEVKAAVVGLAGETVTLAELERRIKAEKDRMRAEAVRNARYPWENPDKLDEQGRTGYNFKIGPESYLKIQWLMDNKGGIKSIQQFLERATEFYANHLLEELQAK